MDLPLQNRVIKDVRTLGCHRYFLFRIDIILGRDSVDGDDVAGRSRKFAVHGGFSIAGRDQYLVGADNQSGIARDLVIPVGNDCARLGSGPCSASAARRNAARLAASSL